jgi:hypothetical protein
LLDRGDAQTQSPSNSTATERCRRDIETINLRSPAVSSTTPLAPAKGPAMIETSAPGTTSGQAVSVNEDCTRTYKDLSSDGLIEAGPSELPNTYRTPGEVRTGNL